MHNIWSQPPLSSSFNQPSCLFDNPLLVSSQLSPKCSCSCCCCCYAANISISKRLPAVNPRFLGKGFSQSVLIQSSFYKRLIFHGRIRQYNDNTCGFPSFGNLDGSYCYEKLQAFKDRRNQRQRGFVHKMKKQFSSNVIDDNVNDVEVMLSLLTDEVGLEYNDVKNRKKCNKEKKSENLDLRKEGSFGGSEGNKDFEVKSDVYAAQTSSSEFTNDLRKEGSYGELEGNKDFEVKFDGYAGQTSSSEYANDLRKDCKCCIDEANIGVSQDWRKKSEKKLIKELCQHGSNVSVNIEPCKQHSSEIFKITDELVSRMTYKRFTEKSDRDKTVIEPTSITENELKVIPEVMVTKPTSIEDNKDDLSKTCDQKNAGSRHSSQGSGPKGPSDEMWHVTDASTQESSEPDHIFGSSENGEPVKTSGRSLWTIIRDMVRLHWKSLRSGCHTPTSGDAKGLSYMSTSSETWFSSHQTDHSNDDNVRKRTVKGLDSPLVEGSSRNTSLPVIKESYLFLKRSPEVQRIVNSDPNHLTELKRRKLVHKDQVDKDNSDEWEETYNLENKQRKEDEMFMKEALLEARKAADACEVPVGAVLVKDGKIIARGYNMVEELQDSTAHAEMICIRKASTIVSSWRLLDTTLYVTLEPCPMCAGAILQARIHTVVWGAPNKLLGADGSWIRLFCDEHGGTSSMPTDIPPAPAHPFHPNMAVRRGVLAVECGEIMKHFFQLRRKKKAGPEPEPQNVSSSISVSHHHHHQHHHSNFLSKIHHALSVIFCL